MLYNIEIFNFSRNLALKVIGNQWYWEYSYPEFLIQVPRYPFQMSEHFRLGECDLLVLPFRVKVRALISSNDVLHSWALPSLGFKLDACPGRLNFIIFLTQLPGIHIGQCRELCGSLHSWMPIIVEFTSVALFIEWLKTVE